MPRGKIRGNDARSRRACNHLRVQALIERSDDESPGEALVTPSNDWGRLDSITVVGAVVVTLFAHPIHLMLSRAY
jgi:hypothetical protein